MSAIVASPAARPTRSHSSSAPRPRPQTARPAPRRLVLTRRGRALTAVLVFLMALVVAGLVLVELGVPAAIAGSNEDQQFMTVTVQPGDTLWGYAQRYAPSGTDPRDYILEIQQQNHLSGLRLSAGSEVTLPLEGAQR